jgi:asparagine synthase (glutamine-hydrolysing)
MLLDTLNADAVRQTNLFQPTAIERLISDHLGCRANLGYHLWGLLILFLWMRQWNIQTDSFAVSAETAGQAVSSAA